VNDPMRQKIRKKHRKGKRMFAQVLATGLEALSGKLVEFVFT